MKFKYTFFLILVLLHFFSIFSQEPSASWNLHQPESGTKNYIARDQIFLDSGFSYTAASGLSFTGSIDESLMCNVDYINIPDSDRSINTNNTVGSISGKYNVSQNGAAEYSIPFDLPPGVNGMVPSLGLAYSSNAGNGIAGWGWSLSGISNVTRGTKSLLQEGDINAVTLDTSDRFFLNGNRLILTSGTYGISGSEYREEIDQIVKVKLLTSGGKLYFEVDSPNGYVSEYKQTFPSTGDIVYWVLNKTSNPDGISIDYNYVFSDGQLILDNVTYSNTIIKFFYASKINDINSVYIYDKEIINNRLLRKVRIKTNDKVFREYNLNYIDNMYSMLSEVEMNSGSGSQMNSTIINWSDNDGSLQGPNAQNISASFKQVKYFCDLNGDGLIDVVSYDDKTTYTSSDICVFSINQGNGTSYTNYNVNLFDGFHSLNIGDFDHDGDDDVLLGKNYHYLVGNDVYQDLDYYFYQFVPNQIQHATAKDIIHTILRGTINPYMVTGDFNGDGETDIIIFDKQVNPYIKYSIYDKYFSSLGGDLDSLGVDIDDKYYFYTLNFNGNSKTDILVRGLADSDSTLKVIEYNRDLAKFSVIASKSIKLKFPCLIGDFNGDGLSDLCPSVLDESQENMDIVYSSGKSFIHKCEPFTLDYPEHLDHPYEPLYISDMNGDGKSDILRFSFTVDTVMITEICIKFIPILHVKLYLSKGSTFEENDITSIFNDLDFEYHTQCYAHSSIGSDVLLNNIDIVASLDHINYFNCPKFYYYNLNTEGNGAFILDHINNDGSHKKKLFTIISGGRQRLVTSVLSGMNINTKFKYASLYNDTVYNRSSQGTYPLFNILAPLYVVRQVDVENSETNLARYSYHYNDVKFNPQFGFRGFSKNSITNEKTDITSSILNNFEGDMYWSLRDSVFTFAGESSLISSGKFNQSIQQCTALSGTKYFQFRTLQNTARDHLTSTTVITDYEDFNTYNIPETVISRYGTDMTITSEKSFYSLPTGYWLPLRINTQTETLDYIDGVNNYVTNTHLVYNSTHPNRIETKTSLENTDKELTETYVYKAFGGIDSIVTSDGESSSDRSVRFEYTDDNRFISQKTVNGQFPVTFIYDDFGRLRSQTDYNGNKDTYDYDSFGELILTRLYDGSVIEKSIKFWDQGSSDTCYSVDVAQTNKGTFTSYYNAAGQLLLKKAPGIYNRNYNYKKEYYDDGKLKREYEPNGDFTEYFYDDYGRLIRSETPQGNITTSYDGKSVTMTDSTGWSEKTVNDFGLVTSVQDEGGTINYTYNSMGLPSQIDYGSYQISLEYDDAGNRTRIDDPNSGVDSTQYNAFGELVSERDARGNKVTMDYDKFGRITSRDCGSDHTSWSYDPGTGLLMNENGSDVAINYTYDDLLHIRSITKEIGSESLETQYYYSATGLLDTIVYPGGFLQVNQYDENGFLSAIKRGGFSTPVWELTGANENGQITGYDYGNNISTTLGYDSNSRIHSISAGSTFSWLYDFNARGNPNYRKNMITGQQENFTFDELNRLTTYHDGSIVYADNGNISSKQGLGIFTYDPNRLNAVTEVSGSGDKIPQDISYTWFNKVSQITDNDNNYELDFTYGPDYSRAKMETHKNSSLTKTKYYAGNYEKVVESGGNTIEYTYIASPAGLVAVNIKKINSPDSLYYIHSDYLGSIMALTDSLGHVVQKYAYDAWGRRMDPADWNKTEARTDLLVDRGYTGHEHLDHFGLINMNGRMYDPALGRFLSPDNYVQLPFHTQSYNRYSYCLNNPLIYTDPSGQTWKIFTFLSHVGKVVVQTVVFVAITGASILAGAFLGGLILDNPYTIVVGAIGGFTIGATESMRINHWIDTWWQ